MVLVYVDDLMLVSTSEELRQEIRKKLKKRFQMSQKVDNVPEELLGIRISRGDGCIELDQSRYAMEVFNNFRDHTVEVRSARTPMKQNVKLSKNEADPSYMRGKDYRGLVGSVLYLHMCTRPDIGFAVKELSRVLDSPGVEAWNAAQHLLEYLYTTHHYAIRYTKPNDCQRCCWLTIENFFIQC